MYGPVTHLPSVLKKSPTENKSHMPIKFTRCHNSQPHLPDEYHSSEGPLTPIFNHIINYKNKISVKKLKIFVSNFL